MNTKPLPIAIALAASGTACIISIYQKVDFSVLCINCLDFLYHRWSDYHGVELHLENW